MSLIDVLKETLIEKNVNVKLFEDPDTTAIGDNEVREELNRRLRDNPEMEVPQGYVKKMETTVGFTHVLPEILYIDEPYKVSYETFADLVFNILDIHLIEP
jgi:hypothetical protein